MPGPGDQGGGPLRSIQAATGWLPAAERGLSWPTAWAEERATVGTDPSADPGAKTEGWAATSLCRPPFPSPFGIGTNAINPRLPFQPSPTRHARTAVALRNGLLSWGPLAFCLWFSSGGRRDVRRSTTYSGSPALRSAGVAMKSEYKGR